ncbi:MAG: hypothetical protein JXQ75_15805 [Phycisphaerae bacterium]|nr:hypothetical protein [Phycisphaerae bacterium]
MANDYLTMEQVCERLGKTTDEVKALVAEAQLSEVRDAGNVFYKQAEVERIAAKEGSSIVDLAAAADLTPAGDEDEEAESFASALSELADASSGLGLLDGSPLFDGSPTEYEAAEEATAKAAPAEGPAKAEAAGPAELTIEDIPEDLPAAPKEPEPAQPTAMAAEIDLEPAGEPQAETAEAEAVLLDPGVPDLGLSGSSIISLDAGLDERKPDEQLAAGEAVQPAKKVGISVFDDEDLAIEADPMGETQIAASVEELDSVGSGSGLLDLTRESDDTSLGPELLDVISPQADAEETETDAGAMVAEQVDDSSEVVTVATEAEEEPYEVAVAATPAARRVAASTTMAGAVPLNVCAIIGVLALALMGLATAAQIQGVWPSFLGFIAKGTVHIVVLGASIVIAAAAGFMGILAGRK